MTNRFSSISSLVLCVAALGLSTPVFAQQMKHDMEGMHHGATTEMVMGEVRAIDVKAHKITLKHGAMNGMPAMTMVYPYKADLAVAAKLKTGDQVLFHAEDVAGTLTITAIQH